MPDLSRLMLKANRNQQETAWLRERLDRLDQLMSDMNALYRVDRRVKTLEDAYDIPVINATQYGARTDATAADNTTFIQAALDKAEADTSEIKAVVLEPGTYTVNTLYIPLGVRFPWIGTQIQTTARSSITLQQSTAGGDVIRFKPVLSGSNYLWYGEIAGVTIYGDTGETTGWGICAKDVDNHDVQFQDTTIFRNITIRRMYQGGIYIGHGAYPLYMDNINLLFNYGPGIHLLEQGQFHCINLNNISGDGNNGGLIRLEDINDGHSSIVITNLKSEMRVNSDYSDAECQEHAIVVDNCDNMRLLINGATHTSSIPDGDYYKKPGDFIDVTAGTPQIAWNGVMVRVRDTDTGTDPLIVGGLGGAVVPDYNYSWGTCGITHRTYQGRNCAYRGVNTDADTTPTVAGMDVILITNTNPCTITDFDDGVDGQLLICTFADTNTTITDGGNLCINGDFTSTGNDTLTLIRVATTWREIARSAN